MPVDVADVMEAKHGLQEYLNRIAKWEASGLVSLRAFTIEEVPEWSGIIQQTIQLSRDLGLLPLSLLPLGKIELFRSAAKAASLRLKELAEYVKGDPQVWKNNREGFLSTFKNNCESFCDMAISVYPYLFLKSSDLQVQTQDVSILITKFNDQFSTAFEDVQEKQAELDSIMKAARDTAAQAGIAHHATRFEEIAIDHQKASRHWLVASICLILLTFGVAVAALWLFPPIGELKNPATIQRIITKLVILSVLYYAVLWSAKNYRTHRHLAVLNSHRQSALHTFDAFVKAASGDDQTKNAVLLEATRCIFSPANTGYLGAEEENQNSRIIEIFKMAGSVSGK